jgi:tetratricopeptide (TPR) repeat protein
VAQYRAELARSYRALGQVLFEQGERRSAEDSLRYAIELQSQLAADSPTMPRYRLDLAETHLAAGRFRVGLYFYPTDEELGHTRRAHHLLSELVGEFPEEPLYRYQLASTTHDLGLRAGKVATGIENLHQALVQFRKLAADFPQVPDYRAKLAGCVGNLGELYSQMGDRDQATNYNRQAIDLFTKLAAEFPTQTAYREALAVALSNWSNVLIWRGENAQARKALEEALSILKAYPNSSYIAALIIHNEYRLAGVAGAQGANDEATKLRHDADQLFEKTWKQLQIVQGPASAGKFCADFALALQLGGDPWKKTGNEREIATAIAAALKAYTQAIELDPNNAETHFRRGRLYAQLSRHEEAAADYSRVIELDPKEPGAWYNDPKEALPWRNRASCYLSLCQYEKAIADLNKVLRANPDDGATHKNLAWVLATCADSKWRDAVQAVEHAKKAVDLDPKQGSYWNTLGVANYRAGDWKAAVAALEKSMELRKGGDSFDWFFLAMARWQLGDKKDARKWYDHAVLWMGKNQPNNEELQRFRLEAGKLLAIEKKATTK